MRRPRPRSPSRGSAPAWVRDDVRSRRWRLGGISRVGGPRARLRSRLRARGRRRKSREQQIEKDKRTRQNTPRRGGRPRARARRRAGPSTRPARRRGPSPTPSRPNRARSHRRARSTAASPACVHNVDGFDRIDACDTVVCLSWSLSHQAPHRWRAASMASSGARLKHRLRGLGTATEGRRHKNQQDAGNTRRRRAVGEVRDVRDGRVVGAGQVRAARGRDDDDARRLVRAALQVGPEAGPVRGELDGLALPLQGQAPGGALACVQR